MGKALIIVESPTKIKTLKKFLGKEFLFESSVGHIRDLPKKGFGIDIEGDFEPKYELLADKKDVIQKLKKAAKACDTVYLAPDPDREGEAIAWHIASILPKSTNLKRVTFNAITKTAVEEALRHPRAIDHALVDAQQARRLLDRIVGYKISPILHRRIKRGKSGSLSAGRVQSIALKLVVDREAEIDVFQPVEYWNIAVNLSSGSDPEPIHAILYSVRGKRVDKEKTATNMTLPNQEAALAIKEELQQSSYTVKSVNKKEKKRHPVPPFITSTLQQEASRHYGFVASRTMSIAQSLYEGVDLPDGGEGLITYMRTDSVRVEKEAIQQARAFIEAKYGRPFLPVKPREWATKKSAQDAHEAIRPTNLQHSPESIKSFLSDDQYKLYLLIWRRFLASQMESAVYDTVTCDVLTNHDILLRATGSRIKFQGFLILYEERSDESPAKEVGKLLPPLTKNQSLDLIDVSAEQAFTKPPPRYTEASLVKELEKLGIGRPSTYAAIMGKIQSRAYTTKEKLTLKPTELGKIIAQMLENHFKVIMDIHFTARMEEGLDTIAVNDKDWKSFLKEFWQQFSPIVDTAEKEAFVPKVLTDILCPQCGAKLHKIWARDKYFYGCSNYPDCKFTVPIEALTFNKAEYADDFDWDQSCPNCGGPMKIRHSSYGAFLGCDRYPDCRGTITIPKKGETLPTNLPPCPAIGCSGKIQARKSRFGKTFFSCSSYPECDVIVNKIEDLPIKYANHEKTPYVKRQGGKGGGRQKTLSVSKALQAVIACEKATRGDVTKKIWQYIKKHDLQDKQNRRLIVPDAKLEKVFGSKAPVDMMQLARVLKPHLT